MGKDVCGLQQSIRMVHAWVLFNILKWQSLDVGVMQGVPQINGLMLWTPVTKIGNTWTDFQEKSLVSFWIQDVKLPVA